MSLTGGMSSVPLFWLVLNDCLLQTTVKSLVMCFTLFLLPLSDIWSPGGDDEDEGRDADMAATGASDEMDVDNPSNNVRFLWRLFGFHFTYFYYNICSRLKLISRLLR